MAAFTDTANDNEAQPNSPVRAQKKAVAACEFCKARRIRCDGVQPCFQCQKRGRSVCVFHGPKRAPKKKAASVEHLEQRIHQLESMLRHQSDSKSDGTTDGSPRFSAANEGASRPWEATANFAGGSNGIFSPQFSFLPAPDFAYAATDVSASSDGGDSFFDPSLGQGLATDWIHTRRQSAPEFSHNAIAKSFLRDGRAAEWGSGRTFASPAPAVSNGGSPASLPELPLTIAPQPMMLPSTLRHERATTFDNGFPAASMPLFQRRVSLEDAVRQLNECVAESHLFAQRAGFHVMPAEIIQRRERIKDLLTQWLTEELRLCMSVGSSAGSPATDELIVMQSDASVNNNKQDYFSMPNGNANNYRIKVAARMIVFHALSAMICSPREDLHNFTTSLDASSPSASSERRSVQIRLQRWLELPSIVSRNAQHGAASANLAIEANNVLECLNHVTLLGISLQDVVQSGSSIAQISPVLAWCVSFVARLDLTRFVLAKSPEDLESAMRLPQHFSFLADTAVRNAAPDVVGVLNGLQELYKNTLELKAMSLSRGT